MMIAPTAIRKICLAVPLFVFSMFAMLLVPTPVRGQSAPAAKILYVGAISINPCQDAKVLADWYTKFGLETKEFRGGYYGKLNTAAGLFAFGIHPKKADAPKKCTASVSVVFRVENYDASLTEMKGKGLVPDSVESDPSQGQFAHFHDPDGNEVTIWAK